MCKRLQGCTKRLFPGCVKLDERVAFCLPTAGRRTQFFHPIFTQPGKCLLVHPCTNMLIRPLLWWTSIMDASELFAEMQLWKAGALYPKKAYIETLGKLLEISAPTNVSVSYLCPHYLRNELITFQTGRTVTMQSCEIRQTLGWADDRWSQNRT